MVISWASQKSTGLVKRVATIDYKFCHGGDTNTPSKLSTGRAQVAPKFWEVTYNPLGFPMATSAYCVL